MELNSLADPAGNEQNKQYPPTAQPIQRLAPFLPPQPTTNMNGQVPAQARPEKRVGLKLKVFIVTAALFMIFCSVIATMIITRRNISAWDVLAAGNSAQQIGGNISDINSQVKALETTATLSQYNQASTNLSKNITIAQNQYGLLQSSPVLKNGDAEKSFQTFQKKWGAYKTYVHGLSSDYAIIGPILVQLTNNQQVALANSKSASANLGAELAAYQELLNAVGRQTATLMMSTDPDKLLLKNLEAYVQNSDSEVNQMLADLSKHKNVNIITSDVTTIAASASSFSDQQDAWTSTAYTTLQHLDPTSDLNSFDTALSKISSHARQP